MNTQMKITRRALLLGLMLSLSASAYGQQDPWAESYRQEYAGKYAEALAAIEPLATRASPSELAIIRSAWLLHLQAKYAEAEKRYQRAIELNPRSIESLYGLMLPQMALYKWADALRAGQKITAVNPWDYTANVRIMICEEALSRWADLAQHAGAMAARYPTDATILVYWARAMAALKDNKRAKELYAQVLERIPTHAEAASFIKSN